MQPTAVRSQIHTLQSAIRDLSPGWTFVVCSSNQRLISTLALLLEQLEISASSIVDLLSLPLPQQDQILVLCDDAGTDGGAEELMRQVRDRLGATRCRFLLCLEPEITQERLLRLWRCRPNAVSCGRNCGTGWLLQAVAAVLRGQFLADPTLQQRLYPPVPCCGLDDRQLPITTRERELIHLVARGHDSPQIAALRQRRCDTIRRQLSVLYRKTGVRDQRGLISWALAHGVIRQVDLDLGIHQARSAEIRQRPQRGVMDLLDRITVEPAIRFGKPCVRGTRLSVGDVLATLAAGCSEAELLEDFPQLCHEDVLACMASPLNPDRSGRCSAAAQELVVLSMSADPHPEQHTITALNSESAMA